MRVNRKPLGLWLLLLMLSALPRPRGAEVDSDGDGVVDSQDPDPTNPRVVPWRSLASWRFSTGTLAGDEGQQPLVQRNVSVASDGFQGAGVRLLAGAPASLKYHAVEPSGRPNISAVAGSLLFRIKPAWSSGTGPGGGATILQTTNFSLRIAPNGSALVLTSLRNGTTVTNVQIPVTFRRNSWSYGLLTYSPEESSLSFDAPSTRVAGAGVIPPANFNAADNFLAIGSAADGSGPINGVIDEIVAFNAPGILSVTPNGISAVASLSPPGLNLIWNSPTNALYEVRRRLVGAPDWEPTRAAFGTNYFDSTVVSGERYDYNVNSRIASVTTGLPDTIGQFIDGSLNGGPLHSRGKLILLVDQTLLNAIEPELGDFISNLVGDGWQILRANVPRHVEGADRPDKDLVNYQTITNTILPYIRNNYAQFGTEIKYIVCIGHVPVPYTGTIADDGHTARDVAHGAHTGAWPSDLLYGDVDGQWTDNLNVTSSSYSFNWNTPGDGRLDQDRIPPNSRGEALLEIPVARIDLSFLPAFVDSEAALLKKYLRKNADFRKGIKTFPPNALVTEYLVPKPTSAFDLAEELASRASPLMQPLASDLFADSRTALFGIQSGPSFFDRINDSLPNIEHTTANLARGIRGGNCAFIYLRGSYFPDWNTQNNFQRSILTLPNGGLTAAAFFAAKSWRADGLAVGQSIGHELLRVINAWSIPGQSVRTLEILGDPTLRFPVLPPPQNASGRSAAEGIRLTWRGSTGAQGYYIYRSTTGPLGPFELITSTPVTTTAYSDNSVPSGTVTYMIRSTANATTGGGTFANLSQGAFTPEFNR